MKIINASQHGRKKTEFQDQLTEKKNEVEIATILIGIAKELIGRLRATKYSSSEAGGKEKRLELQSCSVCRSRVYGEGEE